MIPRNKRWLAHPWLSAMLALSWLLLQHSLAPVHLLSAALIGLVIPRLLNDFLPRRSHINIWPAVQLTRYVLWDILISNIAVAKLVLGPMSRPQPAWIEVPLALTQPTAIALLATIITTTPGTVSCVIDEKRHLILVHALDCSDGPQMAADIKARYEVLLLAIFEGDPHHSGARP